MKRFVPKHPVLTLDEAAKFLRIKKNMLLKLAEGGQVPSRKVGDVWRFLHSALEDWLHGKPTSKEIFLSQAGAFKDDETLMPMVKEIYKARAKTKFH